MTDVPQREASARSFWLQGVSRADRPALEGATTADFAVVGAGFTGLAAAYFLKRSEPSARVIVLESEAVGAGASGGSAGFTTTRFGPSLPLVSWLLGDEKTKQAHAYAEQAVELVERLVRQNRLECDYFRPGLLRLATSPAMARKLHEEVQLAHRLSLKGIEWLDGKAVRQQVDAPSLQGAWWEPRCGLLNPAKYLMGLQKVLEAAGVLFYERSPLVEIQRKLGKLFLRTPKGGVLADKAAITLNAYSDSLPQLRRKQTAVTSHAIVSERLTPATLNQMGWHRGQALEDARGLAGFYRLTPDGRFLAGSRGIRPFLGLPHGASLKASLQLEDQVKRLFPALRTVGFPFRWAGPVSFPTQPFPALGQFGGDRIAFAVGCSGNGIALAHMNGWTLADLIRGERTERTDSFFVNRPLRSFPPGPAREAISVFARTLLWAGDLWSERGAKSSVDR